MNREQIMRKYKILSENGYFSHHKKQLKICISTFLFSNLFIFTLMPAHTQEANDEPAYTKTCLEEPTKDNPDMASVFEECSLAGKYYKANGNIGNASWVYTINGQWDEALALSDEREALDDLSVLYMNQGHIYAMKGDADKAVEYYQKHVLQNSRPIGEGFEDDLINVLPKIFPKYKSEIKIANKMWLELYEPLAKIDELFKEYSEHIKERDFKASRKLLQEVQQVRERLGLSDGYGTYHNAMRLSDIEEVSGDFDSAMETNQQLIQRLKVHVKKHPDAGGWMLYQSYVNLGRIALRKKHYEEALSAFEASQEYDIKADFWNSPSDQWDVQFSIASILSAKGDIDGAMSTLLLTIDQIEQKAVNKSDKLATVRFQQALANLHANQNDYELSIQVLKDVIKLQQESGKEAPILDIAYSFHDLARIYAKDRQYQLAEDYFKQAIDIAQNEYGEQSIITLKFVKNYIRMLRVLGEHSTIFDLTEEFHLDPDIFSGLESVI